MRTIKYLSLVSSVALLILFGCGTMPGASSVAGQQEQNGVLPVIRNVKAGIQGAYVLYEEPDIMTEEGFLAGVFAECTADWANRTRLDMFASFVAGELQYKSDPRIGANLSAGTPNTILDVRGDYGYRCDAGDMMFIPYIGAGYRLLVNDVPNIGLFRGYKREQSYLYLPVGVEILFPPGDKWSVTARMEYDVFLNGRNKSAGERMEQDSGFGCRFSLNMTTLDTGFLGQAKFGIEPFVQYWNIDASSITADGFIEPGNSSTMLGVRVLAEF